MLATYQKMGLIRRLTDAACRLNFVLILQHSPEICLIGFSRTPVVALLRVF